MPDEGHYDDQYDLLDEDTDTSGWTTENWEEYFAANGPEATYLLLLDERWRNYEAGEKNPEVVD